MSSAFTRNLIWSLFATAVVALALTGRVDAVSADNVSASLKRALVTFAISRALNGAISVAQGTELAIEPAGVGVILSVGQILDPINDLVERFSTVMLVASSSIGMQSILLRITSTWGFDLALALSALLVVLTAWLPWVWSQRSAVWFRQLLLGVIFLRFALPLLIISTTFVFEVYLEAEQTAAVSALEGVQQKLDDLNDDPPSIPAPDASMMDRFGALMDQTIKAIDVREPLERLKVQVADASEHIVNLIVIFVLQTVLLPIAFLWIFVELLKGIARRLTSRVSDAE